MNNRKKPKFQIGDTIVVGIYGTVGKVTDIKRLEEEILYEVNESEGLFREEVLFSLTEYEGILVDKEQIDIQYLFFFGDLVKVDGFENDLFKVVGIRTEIWRYKEDAWEEIVYELNRVKDGEWLEADEEDLSLIADGSYADIFLQKYNFLFPKNRPLALNSPDYTNNQLVDYLLDRYNDYKILYQLFEDQDYVRKMTDILQQLKKSSLSKDETT
ncbi:hypothetical protein [Bacillus sp. 2205SS5-2]|uniref:hypothetical protein n=1 Tax=Bacillus sp. 2205SS5-2 TaxID=3109031 RepID=UPI0030054BAF